MKRVSSVVLLLLFLGVVGLAVGHGLNAVTPLDIRDQVPPRFVFGPTVEDVVNTLSPGEVDQSMIPDPMPPQPGAGVDGPTVVSTKGGSR